MTTQMILPCCCVAAEVTIVADSFVNRVNVPLQIGFLCCFIITFGARIPINSVDLTDVLEQISFLIGSIFTLIALKLFSFVDAFDVSLEVGSPLRFKFTLGEWTLVHVTLRQRLCALFYLDARVEHEVHLGFFILRRLTIDMSGFMATSAALPYHR